MPSFRTLLLQGNEQAVNTSTTYSCEHDGEKRQKFDIGILQAASQNLGFGSQSSTC